MFAPGLCSRSSLPSSANAELYRRFHYFPCNIPAAIATNRGCFAGSIMKYQLKEAHSVPAYATKEI